MTSFFDYSYFFEPASVVEMEIINSDESSNNKYN